MAVYNNREVKGLTLDDGGFQVFISGTEEQPGGRWLVCSEPQLELAKWIRDRASVSIETIDAVDADPEADPPVLGVPEMVRAIWYQEASG